MQSWTRHRCTTIDKGEHFSVTFFVFFSTVFLVLEAKEGDEDGDGVLLFLAEGEVSLGEGD